MMNLELVLHGMTWGELREFVAISGAPDDEGVVMDYDLDDRPRSLFVTGFEVGN